MVKCGFQAKEVMELTGLTYRQIDHWVRTTVITPSQIVQNGDRTIRIYSFEDLVTIRAAVTLLGFGLELSAVKKATNWLQNTFSSGNPGTYLFVANKDNFDLISNDPDEILKRIKGQTTITVDIGEIINQLKKDIEITGDRKVKGTGRKKYEVPKIAASA